MFDLVYELHRAILHALLLQYKQIPNKLVIYLITIYCGSLLDETHERISTKLHAYHASTWGGPAAYRAVGLLQLLEKKMVPAFASVIILCIPDVPGRSAGCGVLRI